jgi:hypothetical protein
LFSKEKIAVIARGIEKKLATFFPEKWQIEMVGERKWGDMIETFAGESAVRTSAQIEICGARVKSRQFPSKIPSLHP